MNIPKQYHDIILNEFIEVEKLFNDAKTLEDKLYFFSASFGILNRVMNIHYDPILVFMHQILQSAHGAFLQRLASPKINITISNSIPDKMIEALIVNFIELRVAFEKKDDSKIREVLEKLSNLSYATTGNGFYLYLREKLIL